MKSVWLLTGLLFTALCCSAMPWATKVPSPTQCCFSFLKRSIDLDQIVSIVKTGSKCPKQGFVVTTRRGKVCVDLNQDWLKLNEHN